jgi:RNA polymerase-interacting CarD/CdnL/TRCF family regulator
VAVEEEKVAVTGEVIDALGGGSSRVTLDGGRLPDGQAITLDLSVGARVVYGSHGIGRVSSLKTEGRGSARAATVVVEFSSGLSVILPFERARACLRPLAGAVELDDVRVALRARDVPIEQSWRARSQSTRSKISAGETVGLAEVVRDSDQRARRLTPGAKLSPAEQDLYKKARHLLAAELGAVADLDEGETQTWIDHQLGWAIE